MKKLTVRQFATIKRVAQNVNPLVVKKNKNEEKIMKLMQENEELNEEIKGHEAGIIALTGGLSSEDLVVKRVEVVKVDEEGKDIKATKYVPTDKVEYNEEENCYYIKEEADEMPEVPAEETPVLTEEDDENNPLLG